ncbi:3-dehydrosphinganine reductase [Shimia isoporae]|uniref:3-dehydrosphinganine reductase n=1 Tax=Shimia isoporae TaxID=647720 RepID=A0A4R1N473_9RHOB|nr:SDR family oxidoreductase [Shimia isoporae]TCL01528.1 3-dehydrosphinganine reductase [Shimia isoporae]
MPGPAFVTGGSSGIGLAVAMQLAAKGHDIAIFARDPNKLAAARETILAQSPSVSVHEFQVDVSNRTEITAAVNEAVQSMGAPDYAVASAGIAEPGLFRDQPLATHESHMQVNYFGALYFAHALQGPMRENGGGKLAFLSSVAAFFGIYGYSAYAPTKFALSGLGEVLHLELAEAGISVTVMHPSDTDTPQLAAEKATKPAATAEIGEGGGLFQPEVVAACLIKAMDKNKPWVSTGKAMTLLGAFSSILKPILRRHQRRIIKKHRPE